MRLLPVLLVIAFTFLFIACKKDKKNTESGLTSPESELYGTWIKGPNAGDTLQFMRSNNQDIMRINMSFNPGLPAYTTKEYRFRNGKLEVKTFAPASADFYPIDSFNWITKGREFSMQGSQLYSFMASIGTYFTYKKI